MNFVFYKKHCNQSFILCKVSLIPCLYCFFKYVYRCLYCYICVVAIDVITLLSFTKLHVLIDVLVIIVLI